MRWSVNPLGGNPLTGEPDAGNPLVRFGGRGSEANRNSLPLFIDPSAAIPPAPFEGADLKLAGNRQDPFRPERRGNWWVGRVL